MLTAADIHYDPLTHTSQTPDGIDVPHVTHILSAVGVSTNFEDLAMSSRRLRDRIEYRGALGSAVHADCHAYDDGDLDWATVHPDVRPFVDISWACCREAYGLTPLARERHIFHHTFFYTGILDGIFVRARDQKRILIDLKIGDPEDAAAHLQTAAYAEAWMQFHPEEPIHERWAVRLTPTKRIPYEVHNYSARPSACRDFGIFQACLVVFNHHPVRRPRDY